MGVRNEPRAPSLPALGHEFCAVGSRVSPEVWVSDVAELRSKKAQSLTGFHGLLGQGCELERLVDCLESDIGSPLHFHSQNWFHIYKPEWSISGYFLLPGLVDDLISQSVG